MRKGILVYNEQSGLYDICFGLNDYYGGLHSGDDLVVNIQGEWKASRIVRELDWYLVGFRNHELEGLCVKV